MFERTRLVRRSTALAAAASMVAATLVAAPVSATGADPARNVDQQPVGPDGLGLDCSVGDYPGGQMLNPGQYDPPTTLPAPVPGTTPAAVMTSQTFVASVGNVSSIDLCLTPIFGGATIRDLVQDGVEYEDAFTFDVVIRATDDLTPEGEVSRTTGTFSLADAEADLVQSGAAIFTVHPSEANLTPGRQYAIELPETSVSFVWRATCGGDATGAPTCDPDPATRHEAYPEGRAAFSELADHGFATRFDLEADLIPTITAPALLCPDVASTQAIRATVSNASQVSVAAFDVRLDFIDGVERTTLGEVRIEDGLAPGEGIVFDSSEDFGIDAASYLGAADLVAQSSRRVALEFVVDTGEEVTEADEANDVTDASTLVPCGPSELANPQIVAGSGNGVPTLAHGVTWFSYDDLGPRDVAAGATGFSRQSTATEDGDGAVVASPAYGSPAYGSPAYGSPAYGSPAYGSPAYGSPAYGSPAYGSPAYGSPAYGSPAYGSPAYGSPAYGSPAYGSPAYGSPAYGSPAYGSPAYGSDGNRFAGDLSILLASLQSGATKDILRQVPLVMAPIAPGWEDRLEAHGAAHQTARADVDRILGLPSQDRTLHDVLSLDPPLRVDLNDIDLSRVLNLTMLSVALANQRLADFDWSVVPGIDNGCEAIEKTSHLVCADLIAPDFPDPEQLTLMQLQMLGYHMGSFPGAALQTLDGLVAASRSRTGSTATGNVLFDMQLAHTDFVDSGLTIPASGHFRVQFTPLGNERLLDVVDDPSSVVDCSRVACSAETTMADVEAASAFRLLPIEGGARGSTVADLVDALNDDGLRVFDMASAVIGLHSLNNLPWALFDRDPVDLVALTARTGDACPTIDLRMVAEVASSAPVVDPTIAFNLADGWDLQSIAASVDGAPASQDIVQLVAATADANNRDRTSVLIDVESIVGESVEIIATVCASATLGNWAHRLDAVRWESFTSVADLTIATVEAVPDADARFTAVEVTEQDEPDEGTDSSTRYLAPNGIVTRHITGPDDVDEFVIPVGTALGDGIVLEEGDFIHVVMAPPPHEMGRDADGRVVPVGNNDFDMALFVSGPSPIVDTLFGPNPDPSHGSVPDEEPIIPVQAPSGGLGDPYGNLAASPAYGSPAYGSPAYGSPAYGSPAYGSPAYGSPAYGSDRAWVAPARVLSNQRGDATEHVFTEILPGWEGNELRIQVAGHLGAASDEPYSLWFYVFKAKSATPTQCTPTHTEPTFTQSLDAAEPLPVLQHGVESLIVYAEDLYALEYGETAARELGHSLGQLAANAAVNGVVVDPMDDPDYRALMTQWLTTEDWCDPLAANRVHGALRSLVMVMADQTVAPGGDTSLETVVVLGGDDKSPFARHKDDTTVAHELEHYASIYNLAGLWSPLTAAHAGGYYLSDNPMVSRNPRPWGDEFLWLPDFSASRLLGSPVEVQSQIADFTASGGNVIVDDALVSGEDFLADGAFDAVDVLEANGVVVDRALLHDVDASRGELSDAEDLAAALQRDPGLSLLFQHADQSNLQSALGTRDARPDGVSADEVAGARTSQQPLHFGTIVAGTVCHFGEDVPAAFRGEDGAATWGTTLAQTGTSYLLSHLSYGYGISEGVDLSEELVNLATELSATGLTWGQASLAAKRHFFLTRSDYGNHQRKTIMTLAGSGMPWVTTTFPGAPQDGGSGTFSASATYTAQAVTPGSGGRFDVPIQTPTITVDPVTGLESAPLDVPRLGGVRPEGCRDCFVRHDVQADPANGIDGGTYFEAFADDAFGGAEGTEGRPMVPRTTSLVDVGGRTVGGVVVTGLESETLDDGNGNVTLTDFVNGTTMVSSNVTQAGVQALDVATKGPFANVRMDGDIAYVTLPRASARGEAVGPDGEVLGRMRLDKAVTGTIYFRDEDAPEFQRPELRDLDLLRITDVSTGTAQLGVTVVAQDQSPMVRGVVGLLIDDTWRFADMGLSSSSNFTNGEGQTHHEQVFSTGFDVAIDAPDPSAAVVYIVDAHGSVGFTERKGQALASVDGEPVVGDPEILVTGEVVANWFVDQAVVTIEGESDRLYRVTIDGQTEFVTGSVTRTVSGSGFHEVSAVRVGAVDEAGNRPTPSVVRFGIDDRAPEVFVLTPDENSSIEERTYLAGTIVEIDQLCRDAGSGIATCNVEGANTLDGRGEYLDTSTVTGSGTATITAQATDRVGKTATKAVTFRVVSAYRLDGFDEPIKKVTDPVTGQVVQVHEHSANRVGDKDEDAIPLMFRLYTAAGVPLGDLRLMRFAWERVTASGLTPAGAPTACVAVSSSPYRYSGGRHKFNALPRCGTYRFVRGEVWKVSAIAPDGLRLDAFITMV